MFLHIWAVLSAQQRSESNISMVLYTMYLFWKHPNKRQVKSHKSFFFHFLTHLWISSICFIWSLQYLTFLYLRCLHLVILHIDSHHYHYHSTLSLIFIHTTHSTLNQQLTPHSISCRQCKLKAVVAFQLAARWQFHYLTNWDPQK